MNHLLSIQDLDAGSLQELVNTGERLASGELDFAGELRGKLIGLYFSAPSTRTRTSFFAAAHRMGGTSLVYSAADLQTVTGEALTDTGMVMGLYLDALVMRTNGSFEEMSTIAENSGGMPVINALSKLEHPTQAIADLITLQQEFGELAGKHLLYMGTWNNTAASLVLAISKLPQMAVTVITPRQFGPDDGVISLIRKNAAKSKAEVTFSHDPAALPGRVDAVYITRWQSMGEEPKDPNWRECFQGFKITREFMQSISHARTIFMHDLPAHRDFEVAAEVLDGPASRIRRQAFNKMISAMCVLQKCVARQRRPIANVAANRDLEKTLSR
jgi:ornithine carbamoyltransferase